MSTSQLGQDLNVIQIYKEKQNGYFIEIGAVDGISLSNTYLLETKYNWRGICVEPNPETFEKLKINRPQSHCCDNAIFSETGLTVQFDIANTCNLLSGISTYIDCHKNTVNSNKTTIQVTTLSFNDLLEKYNAPTFIEYLSLDTEGTEYEILKTFNFDKYTIGLIDVEHNSIEPRRTHIRELLQSKGYIYMGENKWDDMYKHSSL